MGIKKVGEAPKWVLNTIHEAMQFLRITEYTVFVEAVRFTGKDKEHLAKTRNGYPYRQSGIVVAQFLKDTPHNRRVLIHEVCHVFLEHLEPALDQVDEALPADERVRMMRLLNESIERVVDTLAYVVYTHLYPETPQDPLLYEENTAYQKVKPAAELDSPADATSDPVPSEE